MRLIAALSAAAWLVAGAAPAGAQSAKPGTFAGSLGLTIPKGAEAEVRAIDRASGTITRARGVPRSGAFSLSLPAGQYLVVGSVVPRPGRGAKITQTQVAISLKAGQRRTKSKLTARKKKRAAKKKALRARAAYVQEGGQVTAGSVATEIPPFTGATGEFAQFNKGMAAMLITDVTSNGGAGEDCGVTVVEVERRDEVLKELELQKSPYFDPSSRVERNFVVGDVEVRGTLQNGAGNKTLGYDLRLVDKRTGAEVGRLTGTMSAADIFDGEQKLAKDLNEELCKLTDTYEVTLHLDGAATFATHSGGGTLDAKLTVKRAGKKSRIYRGSGTLGWSGTSYASKLAGCSYISPLEPSAPWAVTITNVGDGSILVEWTHEPGDLATSSVLCPDDPTPPPIPGQPGPSLIQTTPESFQLPVAGGVQAMGGGFSQGGDGWTNSGTMTVRPGGTARMD
ncbi:MAG: hypothetical protein V9E83_11270 [Baekduia sp.]